MINKQRIHEINRINSDGWGDYVLYWMQTSKRVKLNHALSFAIEQANKLHVPVICAYCLYEMPESNRRAYDFLLKGLVETADEIEKLGIKFIFRVGNPSKVIPDLAKKASCVITDFGYLKHQKKITKQVASKIENQLIAIESDIVIPVDTASNKREYNASTIRRKIMPKVSEYITPVKIPKVEKSSTKLKMKSDKLDLESINSLIDKLDIDHSVNPADCFEPGSKAAQKMLDKFIANKLSQYSDRNDPSKEIESHLSPYINFGQISPIDIAIQIEKSNASKLEKETFWEQLIVRRELAINFAHFSDDYDSYSTLPDWAQKSLAKHSSDKREYLYSFSELENAKTHDDYWNAAQLQMANTGKMHNYMRMYWGKKILEWSKSPESAFETIAKLNNKYELDGRSANGYAGIAWCLGNHDRPWANRPVFGSIRYMNAAGLERKFNIKTYAKKWLPEFAHSK